MLPDIPLVHGGWSDWYNITNCSTTCGEGVITQQRTCTNPSPSCGGEECLGERITNASCGTTCCPGMYYSLYVMMLFTHLMATHISTSSEIHWSDVKPLNQMISG